MIYQQQLMTAIYCLNCACFPACLKFDLVVLSALALWQQLVALYWAERCQY